MNQSMNRRNFLEFLGKGALSLALAPTLMSAGWLDTDPKKDYRLLRGIAPSAEDDLKLSEGFNYELLIRWGDRISDKDWFGYNNDYTAFIPDNPRNPVSGLLWVNHEYVDPKFVSAYDGRSVKTKEQVDLEMYNVGGSILRIEKDSNGNWKVDTQSPFNRRIHALTEIPFNWHEPIAGSRTAIGTLANCSGGLTPWGTILTCEENYDNFWGERNQQTKQVEYKSRLGWNKYYTHPPEHYGWVVEVDLKTGKAQKHIALGRCAHECATVKELADGRVVVYTGDDANDECIYKFIGSKPGSLSEGTLYVANLRLGKWESLDYDSQPILRKHFKNQTEVLIRLREASKMVGGTKMDRPEDIEIDPITGAVFVSLTNNKPKGNYHGSILKIEEADGQYDSLRFKPGTFLAGGEETGFSCPDNMAFDPAGNLWFTSDISGGSMNKKQYAAFKNNGLFVVPRRGPQGGEVIQVASAPNDAEFTGPCFSPDGKTLFLSVQHPGETSRSVKELSSRWPMGGNAIPRPAVVTISGNSMEGLQAL